MSIELWLVAISYALLLFGFIALAKKKYIIAWSTIGLSQVFWIVSNVMRGPSLFPIMASVVVIGMCVYSGFHEERNLGKRRG